MPSQANPKVSSFHFAYRPSPLPFATITGFSTGSAKEPPYKRRLLQGGDGGWNRVGWGKKGRGEGALEPGEAATHRMGCLEFEAWKVSALIPPLLIRAAAYRFLTFFLLSHSSIPIRLLKASSCELGGSILPGFLKGQCTSSTEGNLYWKLFGEGWQVTRLTMTLRVWGQFVWREQLFLLFTNLQIWF